MKGENKMKRKIICVLFALLFVTLTACSSKPDAKDLAFAPYEGFTGAPKAQALQLDNGITLDGVLDENIWSVNKPIKLRGVTKDQTTNDNINTNNKDIIEPADTYLVNSKISKNATISIKKHIGE